MPIKEIIISTAQTLEATVVIADENSVINRINDYVSKMFGYEKDELIGESLTKLMPLRHRALHIAGIKRFMETKESDVVGKVIQGQGLHKDGHEFEVSIFILGWFFDADQKWYVGATISEAVKLK